MLSQNFPDELKDALGRKVEVIAFGIAYVGRLSKVDWDTGTLEIEDKNDRAVLEIERVEAFKVLPGR